MKFNVLEKYFNIIHGFWIGHRLKIESHERINTFDVVVALQNAGYAFLFIKVYPRMVVGQLYLYVTIANLAFDLHRAKDTCVLMQREGLSNIFFCINCFCYSSLNSRFRKWKGGLVYYSWTGRCCRYCFWKIELRQRFSPQYLLPSILDFLLILQSVMSFIEGVIEFIRSLLTLYIPIFFTFRYLMLNDSQRVRVILKFWCILTFYFFVHYILQIVIKGSLVIVIDLAALVALNYNNFEYAEILYDRFVSPFFKSNQDTLQKYIGQLQKIFDSQSQRLKDRVATSAGDRIKGFMGEVLVGVLNPAQKTSKPDRQSRRSTRDMDQDEEDEQELERQKEE